MADKIYFIKNMDRDEIVAESEDKEKIERLYNEHYQDDPNLKFQMREEKGKAEKLKEGAKAFGGALKSVASGAKEAGGELQKHSGTLQRTGQTLMNSNQNAGQMGNRVMNPQSQRTAQQRQQPQISHTVLARWIVKESGDYSQRVRQAIDILTEKGVPQSVYGYDYNNKGAVIWIRNSTKQKAKEAKKWLQDVEPDNLEIKKEKLGQQQNQPQAGNGFNMSLGDLGVRM